jgi:hypothetical protein
MAQAPPVIGLLGTTPPVPPIVIDPPGKYDRKELAEGA